MEDLTEAARLLSDAGMKDAQENVTRMIQHMKEHAGEGFTNEFYETLRTYPHMEKALREFARKVWEEASEAISDWMWNNPSPSGIPVDPPRNPYEERV